MAAVTEADTGILTEEQIDQLLQEAENRLRAKAGQPVREETDDVIALHESQPTATKRKTIPRLQHGLNASYIGDNKGVAQLTPGHLASSQPRVAGQLRSVDAKQNKKREVCCQLFSCHTLA
jgi:hypothetical protein